MTVFTAPEQNGKKAGLILSAWDLQCPKSQTPVLTLTVEQKINRSYLIDLKAVGNKKEKRTPSTTPIPSFHLLWANITALFSSLAAPSPDLCSYTNATLTGSAPQHP